MKQDEKRCCGGVGAAQRSLGKRGVTWAVPGWKATLTHIHAGKYHDTLCGQARERQMGKFVNLDNTRICRAVWMCFELAKRHSGTLFKSLTAPTSNQASTVTLDFCTATIEAGHVCGASSRSDSTGDLRR
jgi:hypothetical protein